MEEDLVHIEYLVSHIEEVLHTGIPLFEDLMKQVVPSTTLANCFFFKCHLIVFFFQYRPLQKHMNRGRLHNI